MLIGSPPFTGRDTKQLYKRILSGKLSLPRWLSPQCHSVLKGLLCRNVEKRLGAGRSSFFKVGGVAALKAHPFFAGLDWGLVKVSG